MSLCHPSNPANLGLVFAGEILHHVVYGIVLQQRVSLRPRLVAADGAHQRRRSVSQRVSEVLGYGNCIGVGG